MRLIGDTAVTDGTPRIVNTAGAEVAPGGGLLGSGSGCRTVTLTEPGVVSRDAGTIAVSWVLSTNVVTRASLPKKTVEWTMGGHAIVPVQYWMKLEPLTVKVMSPDPAVIWEGERLVIVGLLI